MTCISLSEALDLLGPVRAWVSINKETGKPVYWLDGKIVTERAIKTEAHKRWAQTKR